MSRPVAPIRSLSVLIPTKDGIEFLGRVLDRLAAQKDAPNWDLHVVDSGSTDGTLELLQERREGFPVPLVVRRIDPVEFDHGDTRNALAALSAGDLLVFLTQDAIPSDERFLAGLAANFADPEVGAVTCRNLPRPDADPLTKLLSSGDPGYAGGRREVRLPAPEVYAAMDPHERRLIYNFNDVASAIRRELWERHPFPRASFGEDVLMARALLEAGYTVVYDDATTVEHSHDYDAAETRARARVDGRFNEEWLGRTCVATEADVVALCRRHGDEDAAAIAEAGYEGAEAEALVRRAGELREAAFRGLFEGGAEARRESPPPRTALLETERLRVLYVVHGFPPDTWAGTEVYTLNLARELQRRGHEVVVLARAPARDATERDFELREDEFEGLRVLRMVHRLEHANLRESYAQPKAEAAFARVLAEVRPDLVHFQHLIHTSAGLVDVAKRAGLPTVVHCHDYWPLCARVQLIRPDGVRCEHNMGIGCSACVKGERLDRIEPWAARTEALGPALDAGARVVRKLLPKTTLAERAQAYLDLRERGPYVLSAYAACDRQVSPSRFLRDKLLESGAFDPRRFLYSDNGMRTDHLAAIAKRPDPDGRIRVGFVGSLVWYKGGDVLVRAMARLDPGRFELRVHGDFLPEEDPHHAELRELAGPNVHFLGRFDNSRLAEVYAELDVLVVPSIWFENSPITIHEAHLLETPVVASDLGGMAEYVRDGVDGLLFDVGDDAALAATLRRLADEPDLLERLSRDFPPIKTIEEDAALTEARYRSLCTLVRARATLATSFAGVETCGRAGPVEEQGAELVLLRPGGARVEYDLSHAGSGPRKLAIEVVALAGEPDVELAGTVSIDGARVGVLPRFRGGKEEIRRRICLDAELPEGGARTLVVENVDDEGRDAYLRLARVTLEPREPAAVPESRP